MLKPDSIIRPRKIASISDSQKFKNHSPTVLKIKEPDFKVNIPYGYTGTLNKCKSKNLHRKSVSGKVLDEFELYCEKTTLHGLRYVGDTTLTFCERIFWFVAFSVAIGFAAYYITNIYQKWNSSPVIISFSPFDVQLKEIPFPAVTICNMNQAKKTEVVKIKAEGNPKDLKLLDDICNSNDTLNATETTGYNWTNLRNFLIRVGNSCSDMLKQCRWSTQGKSCLDLFINDLTDEGLCCSFNRLPPKYIFRNPSEVSLELNQSYSDFVYDWTPETGFPDDYNDSYIPKKPLGAGANLGLSVVLDAQVDEYYCSSTSSIGFKIIIGNPIETPKMADYGALLSPGVEARFSITPSVREASPNLRSVPVDKRQCYFANERKLIYYRTYSKSNCQQECASNRIYQSCGCVPYYLPKDPMMKFCEQDDSPCVEDIQATVSKETKHSQKVSCSCYSQCSSLTYSSKINTGILDASVDTVFNLQAVPEKDTNDYTVLHLFFIDNHYEKIIKDRLFDFTDLIASTGGLLGVFLGFSVLSLVELIYTVVSRSALIIVNYFRRPFPFLN
ncbi:unnamed protein product [Phyllotreta striolata]|uniref:Uncharacterized protein n=1 Tax=Phyllotreta striolata TaxID=444603 RepID=A0A9N9TVW1_PHYSR|nr:unnamed protein product [Phyllotreta striolata]